MEIIQKHSPNYSTQRSPIDRIVIHWFGMGTLDGADARFSDPASQTSAHYGISGDIVYQWVDENNTAYHAGNWDMNLRSIGIEHDATTEHNASEETYNTSAQLVRDICERHNIPIDREHIIGHREVISTECPGTIDIDKIVNLANNQGGNMYDKKVTVQAIRDTYRRDAPNDDAKVYGKIDKGWYGDVLDMNSDGTWNDIKFDEKTTGWCKAADFKAVYNPYWENKYNELAKQINSQYEKVTETLYRKK